MKCEYYRNLAVEMNFMNAGSCHFRYCLYAVWHVSLDWSERFDFLCNVKKSNHLLHFSVESSSFCWDGLWSECWSSHMDSSYFLGNLTKTSPLSLDTSIWICFFFYIYSGFFPVAINFLRRVPILGRVLNLPGVSTVSIWIFFLNKWIK